MSEPWEFEGFKRDAQRRLREMEQNGNGNGHQANALRAAIEDFGRLQPMFENPYGRDEALFQSLRFHAMAKYLRGCNVATDDSS